MFMKDYDTDSDTPRTPHHKNSILQGFRTMGGLAGLVMMLTGLTYATKLLALIFNALKNPADAQATLSLWINTLNQGEINLAIPGSSYSGAPLLALLTLGALTLTLAWFCLKLITSGAHILSWLQDDADAVKKLLTHAFGPEKKPADPKPQSGKQLATTLKNPRSPS